MQPARKTVEIVKAYEPPALQKLTLQQAKIFLSSKLANFVRAIRPGPPQALRRRIEAQKEYERPWLKKLTPEQLKLLLIGRANAGDENASDLLYLIFHDPGRPQPDASQ